MERLRKEALNLSEKRDVLLMSMDIVKNNESLQGLDECKWTSLSDREIAANPKFLFADELEEIHCYCQRINNRLATIDLCVKTVRDTAQSESLHQVNSMIDSLITSIDRIQARHRCKLFLNACSFTESTLDTVEEDVVADKKFEIAVLGCTLDDQKVVKKRLQALMSYLNKQTISD